MSVMLLKHSRVASLRIIKSVKILFGCAGREQPLVPDRKGIYRTIDFNSLAITNQYPQITIHLSL